MPSDRLDKENDDFNNFNLTRKNSMDLNDLFKNDLSLFNNHFIPSMKLASKKRVGSNILKKYHKPITPYASLLQDETLSPLNKQKLIEFHKTLNPFVLRESIDRKLSAIFKIVRTSTPLSE